MEGMFSECKSLISIPDISIWETSQVIKMVNMFAECYSLISLPDISKWKLNEYIIPRFIIGIINNNINLQENPFCD